MSGVRDLAQLPVSSVVGRMIGIGSSGINLIGTTERKDLEEGDKASTGGGFRSST